VGKKVIPGPSNSIKKWGFVVDEEDNNIAAEKIAKQVEPCESTQSGDGNRYVIDGKGKSDMGVRGSSAWSMWYMPGLTEMTTEAWLIGEHPLNQR
jgi:hypothetical protein